MLKLKVHNSSCSHCLLCDTSQGVVHDMRRCGVTRELDHKMKHDATIDAKTKDIDKVEAIL